VGGEEAPTPGAHCHVRETPKTPRHLWTPHHAQEMKASVCDSATSNSTTSIPQKLTSLWSTAEVFPLPPPTDYRHHHVKSTCAAQHRVPMLHIVSSTKFHPIPRTLRRPIRQERGYFLQERAPQRRKSARGFAAWCRAHNISNIDCPTSPHLGPATSSRSSLLHRKYDSCESFRAPCLFPP
jgi:hypothetical protein